jgi:hypothetical protein
MMEGLRTPMELVVTVVIFLSYGCPKQAIVHAYGLDERTVADWQKRAGKHWKPGASSDRLAVGKLRPIMCKPMKFGQKGGRWSSGWDEPSMPRVGYGWQGW